MKLFRTYQAEVPGIYWQVLSLVHSRNIWLRDEILCGRFPPVGQLPRFYEAQDDLTEAVCRWVDYAGDEWEGDDDVLWQDLERRIGLRETCFCVFEVEGHVKCGGGILRELPFELSDPNIAIGEFVRWIAGTHWHKDRNYGEIIRCVVSDLKRLDLNSNLTKDKAESIAFLRPWNVEGSPLHKRRIYSPWGVVFEFSANALPPVSESITSTWPGFDNRLSSAV